MVYYVEKCIFSSCNFEEEYYCFFSSRYGNVFRLGAQQCKRYLQFFVAFLATGASHIVAYHMVRLFYVCDALSPGAGKVAKDDNLHFRLATALNGCQQIRSVSH
ncbi:MAG: hypothetical protein QXR19_04705 [Candidatus Jordarchaeaceae archaeon]